MSQINALQILQSLYGSADWTQYVPQDHVIYDFIGLPAAGTSQLVFFTNPPGTNDPTTLLPKTYEQTNIEKSGSIGNVFFILTKIRTAVRLDPKCRQAAAVAANTQFAADQWAYVQALTALLRQGVLTFTIQQKEFLRTALPFQRCPPGFGLSRVLPPAAVGNQATSSGGGYVGSQLNAFADGSQVDVDGYDVFPVQVLAPETTFDLRINFPIQNSPAFTGVFANASTAAPAAVHVGVMLEGVMVRPTQ